MVVKKMQEIRCLYKVPVRTLKYILFGSASPNFQERPPQWSTLLNSAQTANRYLTENDYGVPEIEAVMAKIFGNNRKGTEAVAWAQHWTKLTHRKYIETGPESFAFRIQLHHINLLLTPIDRGLQTLEEQNTTCWCFCYIYWHRYWIYPCFPRSECVHCFRILIYIPDDSASEIYAYRSETYGVFNRRFAIFLDDCTPDMFLLAYLLDPRTYPQLTTETELWGWHCHLVQSAYRICTSNASVWAAARTER